DSQALVRSFLDVFPHATLWTSEFHEMLLVGSLQPIELDATRIAERFDRPSVRSALQDVGISSASALLATWVTDRSGLERFAGEVAAVTDDRPSIEYAPWVRAGEISRVLPALLELRQPIPLQHADKLFTDYLQGYQQNLMRFYRASLHAYAGDRQAWAREMSEVMRDEPGNPYYRWFGGQAR
ncbi:spermidine synthase, partial [Pseudomonas gingeri]